MTVLVPAGKGRIWMAQWPWLLPVPCIPSLVVSDCLSFSHVANPHRAIGPRDQPRGGDTQQDPKQGFLPFWDHFPVVSSGQLDGPRGIPMQARRPPSLWERGGPPVAKARQPLGFLHQVGRGEVLPW